MGGMKKQERGFSLIEMALVIAVVGGIIGGVGAGYAQYIQVQRTTETSQRMDKLMNVLSAYVQRYNRLPCPALPNGDGTENRPLVATGGGATCYNNANPTQLYTQTQGVLPWRTLGIPVEMAQDAWGRMMTYKPAPHLTVETTNNTMQNLNAKRSKILNPGAQAKDVGNACRSMQWFEGSGMNEGEHANRAQALFCCNVTPKDEYITGGAPVGWRNRSVRAAGEDNNGSTVANSRWMYQDTDTDNNGSFDAPYHKGLGETPPAATADTPLSRTTDSAVTLISHGNNGALAYVLNSGSRQNEDVADLIAGVEDENVNSTDTVAAVYTHNKKSTEAYDRSGRRAGAGDDIVTYISSDRLYAKAGNASCRPRTFTPVCISKSSGGSGIRNVGWMLDNSGSMTAQAASGGKYKDLDQEAVLRAVVKLVAPDMISDKIAQGSPLADKMFIQTTRRSMNADLTNDRSLNIPASVSFDDKPPVTGTPGSNDTYQWIIDKASDGNPKDILDAGGNSYIAQAVVDLATAMEDHRASTPTDPNVMVVISDGLNNGQLRIQDTILGAGNNLLDVLPSGTKANWQATYPNTALYATKPILAAAKWIHTKYPDLIIYSIQTPDDGLDISARATKAMKSLATCPKCFVKAPTPQKLEDAFSGFNKIQEQDCM